MTLNTTTDANTHRYHDTTRIMMDVIILNKIRHIPFTLQQDIARTVISKRFHVDGFNNYTFGMLENLLSQQDWHDYLIMVKDGHATYGMWQCSYSYVVSFSKYTHILLCTPIAQPYITSIDNFIMLCNMYIEIVPMQYASRSMNDLYIMAHQHIPYVLSKIPTYNWLDVSSEQKHIIISSILYQHNQKLNYNNNYDIYDTLDIIVNNIHISYTNLSSIMLNTMKQIDGQYQPYYRLYENNGPPIYRHFDLLSYCIITNRYALFNLIYTHYLASYSKSDNSDNSAKITTSLFNRIQQSLYKIYNSDTDISYFTPPYNPQDIACFHAFWKIVTNDVDPIQHSWLYNYIINNIAIYSLTNKPMEDTYMIKHIATKSNIADNIDMYANIIGSPYLDSCNQFMSIYNSKLSNIESTSIPITYISTHYTLDTSDIMIYNVQLMSKYGLVNKTLENVLKINNILTTLSEYSRLAFTNDKSSRSCRDYQNILCGNTDIFLDIDGTMHDDIPPIYIENIKNFIIGKGINTICFSLSLLYDNHLIILSLENFLMKYTTYHPLTTHVNCHNSYLIDTNLNKLLYNIPHLIKKSYSPYISHDLKISSTTKNTISRLSSKLTSLILYPDAPLETLQITPDDIYVAATQLYNSNHNNNDNDNSIYFDHLGNEVYYTTGEHIQHWVQYVLEYGCLSEIQALLRAFNDIFPNYGVFVPWHDNLHNPTRESSPSSKLPQNKLFCWSKLGRYNIKRIGRRTDPDVLKWFIDIGVINNENIGIRHNLLLRTLFKCQKQRCIINGLLNTITTYSDLIEEITNGHTSYDSRLHYINFILDTMGYDTAKQFCMNNILVPRLIRANEVQKYMYSPEHDSDILTKIYVKYQITTSISPYSISSIQPEQLMLLKYNIPKYAPITINIYEDVTDTLIDKEELTL